MDNRREPLIITALVAGMLGIGAAQPMAESDARPTLAVVSFTGTGLPPELGDAMADELTAQFVDTGRYRVMPRDWLMASAGPARASLAQLRESAAAARIGYLVTGEAQFGMSLGAQTRNILFLDVRVISVATGDVIRTATGRTVSPLPRPLRRPLIGPMGLPRRPAGVLGHTSAAAALAGHAKPVSAPAGPSLPRATVPGLPGPLATRPMPPRQGMPGVIRLVGEVASARRAKHAATPAVSPPTVAWKQALADIARAINLSGESR
jgi:hypothetical protein